MFVSAQVTLFDSAVGMRLKFPLKEEDLLILAKSPDLILARHARVDADEGGGFLVIEMSASTWHVCPHG